MKEKYKNILSYTICIILGTFFIYHWGIKNIYAQIVLGGSSVWLLIKDWMNRLICFSSSIIYFSIFSYFFVSENYFFGYGRSRFFLEYFVPIPFGEQIPFFLAIIGYLFILVILISICDQDDDK